MYKIYAKLKCRTIGATINTGIYIPVSGKQPTYLREVSTVPSLRRYHLTHLHHVSCVQKLLVLCCIT